ncbi:MAG: hypothetical protein ACLGG8_02130 [Gammaproteobacteria bacterium]
MNKLQQTTLSLVLTLPFVPAWAAGDRAGMDAQYRADRQACMARPDPESRRDCLRDVGAVRQEALRGTRDPGVDAAQLERNALARCTVHKDKIDHALCLQMVRGEGQASGSVEGGGVIRQIEVEIDTDVPR